MQAAEALNGGGAFVAQHGVHLVEAELIVAGGLYITVVSKNFYGTFTTVAERLNELSGITIVYVSHAISEVARLADHVVLMDAGKVVAAGAVGELLSRLDLPLPPGEDAGVVLLGEVGALDAPWHLARLDVPGASFWTRDPGLANRIEAALQTLPSKS